MDIKKQQKANKKNDHIIWVQKINTNKKIDAEEYIKNGKKERIDPIMSHIDEEKYPLIINKNTNVEQSKSDYKKGESNIHEDLKKKYSTFAENCLKEMEKANKNLIIDNAKFVIKMSNVLILNDKKANLLQNNNLNFKDYKYINDKLFPQINKNTSIKTNNAIHFKELKKRSEYDPKVRKYCRELEEKIERDISYKLSDNYYEQKNRNLKNIFVNKPDNYYVKENKANKSVNEKQNQKRSKSNTNNTNNRISNNNDSLHRNVKSNSSVKSDNSKSKKSSSKNKVRIVTNGTRQGTVESGSVKKASKIKDKKKSVKPQDSNYEIANSKKEIVENIMIAVEPKNVENYISTILRNKSKKLII